MSITLKEASSIENALQLEQDLVKKYRVFASVCTDPQLKLKFEQIAAEHQSHYNRLISLLN